MKYLFCYITLCSVLLANMPGYAQPCANTTYRKTYRSPTGSIEVQKSIAGHNNSTLLLCVADFYSHIENANPAFSLINIHESGSINWSKKINMHVSDIYPNFNAITLKDGSYLVSLSKGQQGHFLLLKINTAGEIVWSTDISFPENGLPGKSSWPPFLYDIRMTEASSGDDIYIAANFSKSPTDFFSIVDIVADGKVRWDKSFFLNSTERDQRSLCTGIHEQGDSLIITGTAVTNDYRSKDDLNVIFSFKTSKQSGLSSRPVAWQKPGYFIWNTLPRFTPVSSKIEGGVCIIEGGYDLPPEQSATTLHNIYSLVIDNNLQLKNAAEFVMPSSLYMYNTRFTVLDNGNIVASNSPDNNALYVAIIDGSSNTIAKQEKFLTQSNTPVYDIATISKNQNGAQVVTLNYQNESKTDCFDVLQFHEQNQEPFYCAGADTSYLTRRPYKPVATAFEFNAVYGNISLQENADISLADMPVQSDYICGQTSTCDNLKIIGPDTVCNNGQEVIFTARLNKGCLKKVKWKMSADVYAEDGTPYYATIRMLNDTSCAIKYEVDEFQQHWIKLEVFVDNCTTMYDTKKIIINPRPTFDQADVEMCPGHVRFLSPGFGYTNYEWSTGGTYNYIEVPKPGTYFVNFTYCNTEKAGRKFIVSYPAKDHFFDDRILTKCNTDSISMTLDNAYTYDWQPDYNMQLLSNNTVKLFPLKDTVYKVSAMVSESCYLTDSVAIKVGFSLPISLGNDTSICTGNALQLHAPDGFEKYKWNDGTERQSKIISNAGTYFLSATDSKGCVSSDTISLNVLPLPGVLFPTGNTLCKEQTTLLDGGDFPYHIWQDKSTGRFFKVENPGKYFVSVTDGNQCSNSDTIEVIAVVDTPANFTIKDTTICAHTPIFLQPKSNDFVSFLWNTGSLESSIQIKDTGNYSLQVMDKNGCTAKEAINVLQKYCENKIIFPNTFSPNNDGFNDIFKPFVSGEMVSYTLQIYDRWGNKIFQTSDYRKGWTSNFLKGSTNHSQMFVWVCNYQFVDEKTQTKKGTVLCLP